MTDYEPALSLSKDRHTGFPKRHPKHPSHRGHERAWTAATGVWYCRTCEEHYRVLGERDAS